MTGPLAGIRVIELGGIGPSPYCGMLLADLGADVIRIERASQPRQTAIPSSPHFRNRRSIALNLRTDEGKEIVLRLLKKADACTEGFRPGVAERMGIGPDDALKANPKLVYGRMTGWGQEGPLAMAAGHDINYVALSGALHAIGPTGGQPVPPMNALGDFAGGGLFLAFGLLAAILHARQSGEGQVVDMAMIDGVASLISSFTYYRDIGMFPDDGPGTSQLGGAAHYYGVYETADGKFISIGSLEPQFYAELIKRAGLDEVTFAAAGFAPGSEDRSKWPKLRQALAEVFSSRTRDEWCAILEGTDVCFAPVLGLSEVGQHSHHLARSTYVDVGGEIQNAPAPRFSRTPADNPRPAPPAGCDTRAVLQELGIDETEIDRLREAGVIT